jgi:hypothetical protein
LEDQELLIKRQAPLRNKEDKDSRWRSLYNSLSLSPRGKSKPNKFSEKSFTNLPSKFKVLSDTPCRTPKQKYKERYGI